MSIIATNLGHMYSPGTSFAVEALRNVNLEIKDGEIVGLIGHTGSGKSTLIQHFNGLLKPTSGRIEVQGINTAEKGTSLKKLRQKVGLVFQYPEHQLFEETVAADVAFGPKNLGLSPDQVTERVREALAAVDLDYEAVKDRSPFELSGGQMRRVAVAGVLAMAPEVLILDEPTAGLDPRSRREILSHLRRIHSEQGLTMIIVSHSMEEVATFADRIIVMDQGTIHTQGTPREVFTRAEELQAIGLDVPPLTRLMLELSARGYDLPNNLLTLEEVRAAIRTWKGGRKQCLKE
ncbi:MAG: energy-coupling factor transporter ATPase [Firmicutes bacterium]|nr:energy-coupling factor transporter ATPase [Bacillota bacterium]